MHKGKLFFGIRGLILLAAIVGGAGLYFLMDGFFKNRPPIRIGVLHSLSGTMAENEAPLVEIIRLVVDEINDQGGLLGRPVEVVVADSRSDEKVAAIEAERLIRDEQVTALFGCWTSACRKAIKPVVEANNHLLFYPLQYEGVEQSPHIIYTGAAPNQQIIPAAVWALENLGKRVFLVGSDYVFPRMANLILNDVIRINGGEVVGEHYLPLGGKNVDAVIEAIRVSGADVILNTVNGSSNGPLFTALSAMESSALPPVISFSISEVELAGLPQARGVEHYAAWNYFQSLDNEKNQAFIRQVRRYLGPDMVIGDPMEAAYIAIKLWASTVRAGGSETTSVVRQAVRRQSLNAPEGIVSVDPLTQHLWKIARIGKVMPDGQFEVVWSSKSAVRPQPFPSYHPRAEWLKVLQTHEARP
jgi:urea transport system substrate-binding protein